MLKAAPTVESLFSVFYKFQIRNPQSEIPNEKNGTFLAC
jgi:hypothetical protein